MGVSLSEAAPQLKVTLSAFTIEAGLGGAEGTVLETIVLFRYTWENWFDPSVPAKQNIQITIVVVVAPGN